MLVNGVPWMVSYAANKAIPARTLLHIIFTRNTLLQTLCACFYSININGLPRFERMSVSG
jgi:hypothetical protein